jgi:hypothetical protein
MLESTLRFTASFNAVTRYSGAGLPRQTSARRYIWLVLIIAASAFSQDLSRHSDIRRPVPATRSV